jgi:hypothetical protein
LPTRLEDAFFFPPAFFRFRLPGDDLALKRGLQALEPFGQV